MKLPSSKEAASSRLVTSFSYLSFLFILPLLLQHKDEFAKLHVRQGIVLFFFEIIVTLVAPVPLFGWILGPLGWLASLVFAIYGLLNVFSGSESRLPYIGKYAEKVKI